FGVGTIDQAMYVALNTRHNALRLVGLAGKVVILDEVHAYDTYMTTIVERLLEWLGQCGTSVILLSATLPTGRRQRLLKAYTGRPIELDENKDHAYPSVITVSRNEQAHLTPEARPSGEATALHFLAYDDEQAPAKAEWLLQQVREGGCACWVANTVRRAQEIFTALRQAAPGDVRLTLLHARFPLEERQQRERELLHLYGKEGQRPERGIVVGTQVLEQSLDVDFDVMASDHAPVDLLLQREGRLHRHARPRPAAHLTPRLYVNAARAPGDELILGVDRHVYNEYILRRSWYILRQRTALNLPTDYRPLIEYVYDETPPEEEALKQAYQALLAERNRQQEEARWRVIQPPHPTQPFCTASQPVFDEDEDSAAWLVAQTRLGQESVTLIPLERHGDQARLVPLNETVALGRAASREMQLRLLRRSMRVSQPTVVQALKAQNAQVRTPLFTESSLLKHVQPLWLTDGQAALTIGGHTLMVVLDEELGLQFTKGDSP
ncbi:MAG: CRISPR-associated helicase Cas3', partial [Ardenticatenaceae bacterium]